MDLFHGVFRWHDRYVPVLEPDGLRLLSEDDALLFAAPSIVGVAQALAQRLSLAELCRQPPWNTRLAVLLHALRALAVQGHVVAHEEPGTAHEGPRYAAPDPSVPGRRRRVSGRVDVIDLCREVDDAASWQWARDLDAAMPSDLTVVFCDDLLDPRLRAVALQQRARGRAWLPVKPTGSLRSVGPLILPHGEGGACWDCLAHRLLRNQPVRAWWQTQRGAWPRVPVRCDAAWVAHGLQALHPLAAHTHEYLYTLGADGDDDSMAPRAHFVARRPQCPACGDPGLMAEHQSRPIEPAGQRAGCVPVEVTIERLMPHVSPLCGLISHLAALSPLAGAVHRSGFFKTPPADEAPPAEALAQLCLGKGLDDAQSQASALCEAVERYAAFHQGDEACVEAAADALDAPAWLPQNLVSLGEHTGLPCAARACGTDVPMRWAPAWSLTRQTRCYLPLGFCYAHAPAEDTHHIGWTSNGCAAGNTLEEAIVRGFFELVERDAVAVWWYNRIERPGIDMASLSAPGLDRLARALDTDWDHWLLDITHDLGLPVVAAVACHRHTADWVLGFGCAIVLEQACERALAELLQLIAVDQRIEVPDSTRGTLPRFMRPHAHAIRVPHDRSSTTEGCKHLVRLAAARSLETIVLDYSRPDIPLHTVKVVIPGLSHIWPQWTTARLRSVPVALGWLQRPLEAHEMNPQPLFV